MLLKRLLGQCEHLRSVLVRLGRNGQPAKMLPPSEKLGRLVGGAIVETYKLGDFPRRADYFPRDVAEHHLVEVHSRSVWPPNASANLQASRIKSAAAGRTTPQIACQVSVRYMAATTSSRSLRRPYRYLGR